MPASASRRNTGDAEAPAAEPEGAGDRHAHRRGDGVPHPEILTVGKSEDRRRSSRADAGTEGLPPSHRRHPAPGAAHARREGEGLLASFGLTQGQAGSIYRILANSGHAVADDQARRRQGTEARPVRVHEVARSLQPRRPQEGLRRVLRQVQGVRGTFGATYYSSLKEDARLRQGAQVPGLDDARARRPTTCRVAVYDALIKSTNENLPTLHRYFRLRAKMLGVAEMRYYDIYPPLISGGREYPIDEGVRMMVEAVSAPRPDYVAAMKKGLADRWMDVYPRPKKLSGAHMAGARLRRAPVPAHQLQRQLRVGLDHRARVGPRDALVPLEQGAALPDSRATQRSWRRSPRPPTRRCCSTTR